MVASDTAYSAESPPVELSSAESSPTKLSSAESPPAKLSSAELSPTKPVPTMDLIPVTSKAMDHAPVTLLFQVMESLCDDFFPGRHLDFILEAVEIAVKQLTPQAQSKFMHALAG
ncbi:hypothetical protein K440DRAFT_638067 [Wilcoxina mikolae CBS 423.85]|nr:hypothetical protein K440DRAFT_638067 [Wilcoxina mikolae CBS 423.85]